VWERLDVSILYWRHRWRHCGPWMDADRRGVNQLTAEPRSFDGGDQRCAESKSLCPLWGHNSDSRASMARGSGVFVSRSEFICWFVINLLWRWSVRWEFESVSLSVINYGTYWQMVYDFLLVISSAAHSYIIYRTLCLCFMCWFDVVNK